MVFIERYLSYFFVYAIIGWIIEVAFHAVSMGKFVNRGFLNGPYCPIYGFGALAVLYFLSDIAKTSKLTLFIGSIFIASLIELVGGFLLEKIFHQKWWDYSDRLFNLGGYICIEFSVLWGMACFILYEAIHPLIKKSIGLINPKVLIYINILFLIIFIVDLIVTVLTLIGLNKKFKKLQEAGKDIRAVSDDIGKAVYDGTIRIKTKKESLENSPKIKELEASRMEILSRFDKAGEKRIIKAFPNLIKELNKKLNRIEENNEK